MGRNRKDARAAAATAASSASSDNLLGGQQIKQDGITIT
jgi:hypothetical protein